MNERANSEHKVPALLAWAAAIAWRFLAIGAAAAVVAFLIARLSLVIVPILVALLAASVLHPPGVRLVARKIPPGLATFLVFAAALVALWAVAAYIGPAVASELDDVGETLAGTQEGFASWLDEEPWGLTEEDVRNYLDSIGEQIGRNRGSIMSGILVAAVGALQIAGATALAIVLAFFFVKDRDRLWAWVVAQFPRDRHDDVREAGRHAWDTMQGYVRGITIIAFVDAILIGIALVVVGVPLALPLSVLVFLGAFVPIVGAFVSGLVAVAVALLTSGPAEAAIVAAVITAIQQLEGHILQPIVMGRTVKLHPVVVLLAIGSGIIVAGIAGAFLAVPIVATLTSAGGYLRRRRSPAL